MVEMKKVVEPVKMTVEERRAKLSCTIYMTLILYRAFRLAFLCAPSNG